VAVLLGFALERRRGARPGGWHRFARPPWHVGALALVTLAAFAAFAARLRVGTHQWSASPLMFVDVRADLEQPVILREIDRLTEVLRAQPGVASAWSVADLFKGVDDARQEATRIPPDADDVRDVLAQARMDPAVQLELAPARDEALVVVRFDEGAEASTDRLDLMGRLATYVAGDLRAWLVPVDLRAATLPAETRGLAKGLLASDTRERVLSICARSGRPLTPSQELAVERVARQTAAVPTADPDRLHVELVADARDFVAHYPVPLRAGEQARLVDALAALPDDATTADVSRVVAAAYDDRLSDRVLTDTADIVQERLVAVRWRHTARINFRDMLTGADLPTEGVLADEVRGATLEGMGPVVGVPVGAAQPSALHLDAAAVGGAANDRALSDAWFEGARGGVTMLVAFWAALLLVVGGVRSLAWLPVGLAPAGAAALASALLREPLGLWSLAFVAGALAAGGVVAIAFAARRPS
jgi:hypothetical protein